MPDSDSSLINLKALSDNTLDTSGIGQALGPPAETFSDIVKNLFGPAARAAGGALGDSLKAWRLKNLGAILEDVKKVCAEKKIDISKLPKSLLLPGLEAMQDVDDPDLQRMWVNLTCNAAAEDANQQKMFFKVMESIGSSDARQFEDYAARGREFNIPLGAAAGGDDAVERLISLGLLEPVYSGQGRREGQGVPKQIVRVKDARNGREMDAALEYPHQGPVSNGVIRVYRPAARVSPFGLQFFKAVSPPAIAVTASDAP
jgi:hypothetical protein